MSRVSSEAHNAPAAEARFLAWLEHCMLPNIFMQYSPLATSLRMKADLKIPHFLVGVPTIGTIAFEVQAKPLEHKRVLIDAEQHRQLLNFETYFSTSVWHACFPPDQEHACHLILNRTLANIVPVQRPRQACIAVPPALTTLSDDRRDFMAAIMSAIRS